MLLLFTYLLKHTNITLFSILEAAFLNIFYRIENIRKTDVQRANQNGHFFVLQLIVCKCNIKDVKSLCYAI